MLAANTPLTSKRAICTRLQLTVVRALDTIPQAEQKLLELLRRWAFQERPVTLASGRTSNFYIDCKQVSLDPEGHVLIGQCLFDRIIRYEATGRPLIGAGGLTLGADPLASAVSTMSALLGRPLAAYIVRKEPKGHGTDAWLEGVSRLPPGGELVVLEDVVTTGGSALKAVQRVRNAGFQVRWVLGLIDRLEGGREALEAEGLQLDTLFSRVDFMGDRKDEPS